MKVAIIDADLIGRLKHRFPNLACMKISAFNKQKGHDVVLKLDWNNLEEFDRVFISKVFMDTEIPFENGDKSLKTEENITNYYKDNPILNLPNVEWGGLVSIMTKLRGCPRRLNIVCQIITFMMNG